MQHTLIPNALNLCIRAGCVYDILFRKVSKTYLYIEYNILGIFYNFMDTFLICVELYLYFKVHGDIYIRRKYFFWICSIIIYLGFFSEFLEGYRDILCGLKSPRVFTSFFLLKKR